MSLSRIRLIVSAISLAYLLSGCDDELVRLTKVTPFVDLNKTVSQTMLIGQAYNQINFNTYTKEALLVIPNSKKGTKYFIETMDVDGEFTGESKKTITGKVLGSNSDFNIFPSNNAFLNNLPPLVSTTKSDIHIKLRINTPKDENITSSSHILFKVSDSSSLKQDNQTFEPNDFLEMSYFSLKDMVYSSSFESMNDKSDWYKIHTEKGKKYNIKIHNDYDSTLTLRVKSGTVTKSYNIDAHSEEILEVSSLSDEMFLSFVNALSSLPSDGGYDFIVYSELLSNLEPFVVKLGQTYNQINFNTYTKEALLVIPNNKKGTKYFIETMDVDGEFTGGSFYGNTSTIQGRIVESGQSLDLFAEGNTYTNYLSPIVSSSDEDIHILLKLTRVSNVHDVGSKAIKYKIYTEKEVNRNSVTLEPNNYKELAVDLLLNKWYSSSFYSTNDKKDWYELNSTAGNSYFLKMQNDYFSDLKVDVDNGGVTNTYTVPGHSALSRFVTAASDKLLISYSTQFNTMVSGYADGSYKFVLYPDLDSGLEQNATTHEPNDNRRIPFSLKVGDKIEDSVTSTLDESDWYVVSDAEIGATYEVVLTASEDLSVNRENNGFVRFDENNNYIYTLPIVGENGVLKFQVAYPHLYTVDSDSINYSFVVRKVNGDLGDGVGIADAVAISNGVYELSTLGVNIFTFEMIDKGYVSISTSSSLVYFDLIDSQGKRISQSTAINKELDAGKYYIKVKTDYQSHNLTIFSPMIKDGVNLDDTQTTNVEVQTISNGSYDIPSQMTAFLFTLVSPSNVTLKLSSYSNCYVKLNDSNGRFIEDVTASGINPELSSGSYYLVGKSSNPQGCKLDIFSSTME